jgi:tRNA A-37 threonylcarbamoyl transferase component Bud32
VIRQTHDHFRWQSADDFAPLLANVLRAAPSQVVKDDRAKFVARVEVKGRAFYMKRYRHGAFPLRPLKFFLKRSQAAQEFRLAAKLEQRGAPVVRHVALGKRWSARGLLESVLITEAFDGVPLEARHEKFFPQVARFVDGLAQRGLTHNDFHPANLLINEATGELRLIDLYGARIFDGYPAENLSALLLAQLRVTLPLPVSEMVAKMGARLRREKLAQRARRCLKDNRDFTAMRFGKFRWQVRRSTLTPGVEAVLRDPDGFLARASVLKAGQSSTVGALARVVLKRHNFKKPLSLLKDLFRGSRGRRDFLKGYHLELCGIQTARVLATADDRVCGIPFRSFVLMEEVPDAVDARKASDEGLMNLARLLARLHEEGFTHRDLKPTNILFDAKDVPHMIDLDGLRFVDMVTVEESAGNVGRFLRGMESLSRFSDEHRANFLNAYCRARKMSRDELWLEPLFFPPPALGS